MSRRYRDRVRLYVRAADRRPQPPLPPVDDRRPVAVGTLIWAVLLVAALLARDDLAGQGRGWWVWTPVAGIALGLLGLVYVRRRD